MIDLLQTKVSFQPNSWSPISKELSLLETFDLIRSRELERQMIFLRKLFNAGDKEAYINHKRTLPGVTYSATFHVNRTYDNLKFYNSIIVLDIDKINNDQKDKIKFDLDGDEHVFAYWESPSQAGLKGLVQIKYNFEIDINDPALVHKSAFKKLAAHLKENYNIELDNSGSDITRLCFFSFDQNLVLKENFAAFEINELDLSPITQQKSRQASRIVKKLSDIDLFENPEGRNKSQDRLTISSIIRFLKKRNLSITYSYDKWFRVAVSIANTFTYKVGEKYFLELSSLDVDKYDVANCKNFLYNCYQVTSGSISFKTIVFLAKEKGYVFLNKKERGSEAVNENLS